MFIINVMGNFVKPSVKGNPRPDSIESAPLTSLEKKRVHKLKPTYRGYKEGLLNLD